MTASPSLSVVIKLHLALGLCIAAGCSRKSEVPPPGVELDALVAMRQAMQQDDWQKAQELSGSVLIEENANADALSDVALVAYKNGDQALSAELLVESCRVEDFADAGRVQQALVGLLNVGRLFDGIELLEEYVQRHPDDSNVRRSLYDFLVGTEQHLAAIPHAEQLVKRRAFDASLLGSLLRPSKRTSESKSLETMVDRNPSDLRPLIGVARRYYDATLYDQAKETCTRIIAANPRFIEAHAMLGQTLSMASAGDTLEQWITRCPPETIDHPEFWLALATLAEKYERVDLAFQALTAAVTIAPNRLELWRPLNHAANRFPGTTRTEREAISDRAKLLVRLRDHHARFNASGGNSTDLAIEIATSLVKLGRIWEAEAWTALGFTFNGISDEQKRQLTVQRNQIIKQLSSSTPWQHPLQIADSSGNRTGQGNQILGQLIGSSKTRLTASRPLEFAKPVPIALRDEASNRGISFYARTSSNLDEAGIPIYHTLGCGGGTLDYDLDGWPDLYLVTGGGAPMKQNSDANRLYRNLDGQFAPIPEMAIAADTGFGHGVAVGDLNEDGFADLFVTNFGMNRLWVNQGDGTFEDASTQWVPDDPQWSTSAAIADLDLDGISDVFVVNYCERERPLAEFCESDQETRTRACSPVYFAAQPDQVLRGRRTGGLVDTTNDWGMNPDSPGRGLGVMIGDFNEQTGCEILVANDMSANQFWVPGHAKKSRWNDSAPLLGLDGNLSGPAQGSMGIAAGDLNVDGVTDFVITNFEKEYNSLHLSTSGQSYRDVTTEFGMSTDAMPLVSFGTQLIDLDLNGADDLAVTNGHVDLFSTPMTSPFYQQPFQLYHRDEAGNFVATKPTATDDYLSDKHCGRALWTVDANRDGRNDIVITHQTERVALLMNETPTPYKALRLNLIGTAASRDAIGSRVQVAVGDSIRTLSLTSGDGYMCNNERQLVCGLGNLAGPVSIKLTWPGGTQESWILGSTAELGKTTRWLLVQGQHPFQY